MKISSIRIFHVPILYKTQGQTRTTTPLIELPDTVVEISTGCGLVGYGESCPLAPIYLHAMAGGVRASLEIICPLLIGRDPRDIGAINNLMDRTVRGFPAAKSAIDMACWDILGKATNLPVKTLLGGAEVSGAPSFECIPVDTPEKMVETVQQKRDKGLHVFGVKLGQSAVEDIERMEAIAAALKPHEHILCDANRGWTLEAARRVAAAADELPSKQQIWIEQPCATYDECVTVRRMCRRPIVLDEVIDDSRDLVRASAENALDGLVIKLSHAGGLTKAREMAQLAMRLGIRVRIEDTAGLEVIRAATTHLAVTLPEKYMIGVYAHLEDTSIGPDSITVENGLTIPSDEPGFGFEPDMKKLGEPIQIYE